MPYLPHRHNHHRRTMAARLTARRTLTTLAHLDPPVRARSVHLARLASPLLAGHPAAHTSARTRTTSGSGYSPLNDPSPNWSNRPPKETILLDGCDYEHWLIVMEFPEDPKPSEDEMISAYVRNLAQVVGSEEEAKKKIYSVCTTTYTGFGCLISEELSFKVKGLPGVLWVLPDSYLDVPNKDYGGDLFIDGKVIHRPQYWYNERQQVRKPRPRYDRHRDTMQVDRNRDLGNRRSWPQSPPNTAALQASSEGQNSIAGGRDVTGANN